MKLKLPVGDDTTASACGYLDSATIYTERGEKWVVGNFGSMLYNYSRLPNAAIPNCTNTQQQNVQPAARSNYLDGANVLARAGSVILFAILLNCESDHPPPEPAVKSTIGNSRIRSFEM